ncbi:unnamed protein product [Blepharisma stoltei]|uniref:Myb-like DNA-binding domain containing protein n=1 Tax=Blepharisma stoltei TaxID=1481888 RepID=A0AAU9I490_9CILI|nr:unnamed protein product [Blepharisma stoltei]
MRQKTTKKSKFSIKSSKDSYTKRRSWTSQEDEAIRRLVKENGIKQWTVISEKLSEQFNTQRTGKQCRERWHNHLNPGINKDNWSLEEELCLFESHEKLGNKWAEISKILQGRTDNSIKNHFYSTLRKRFRKIKGYDGTRDDIKQHNKFLSAKILGSLKKMTEKIQDNEVSTNLDENSIKREEKIQNSDSFADFMPLVDNELIITGHHISNPYILNMNSYHEEAPAEFLWTEDPFLCDEVYMISLK